MKRGAQPERRTPLKRIRRRRAPAKQEPGRADWQQPMAGPCDVCGRATQRLARHHVIYAQHVRAAGGDVWDLRNSMLVCPDCHERHHNASRRIPLPLVPGLALDFATCLYGVERAAWYFALRYAPEIPEGHGWQP